MGYAPLNITYLDARLFQHGVDHAPTNKTESLPFFVFFCFFLSDRYDRHNDPQKNQSDHNSFEKKKAGRPAFRLRAHAVEKYEVSGSKQFRSKSQN